MRKSDSLWVLLAGPSVTLAVSFGWTFDSVSAFKLLVMAFFAGMALARIFNDHTSSNHIFRSPIFFACFIMIIGLLMPLMMSGSPFAQQIYGVAGRHLGFLHYLFLIFFLLAASSIDFTNNASLLLKFLSWVGTFEAIYAGMQYINLDPQQWRNPDRWLIGTLGNPDYLSSFLSLAAISSIYLIWLPSNVLRRSFYLVSTCLQVWIVYLSGATQGLVLLAFGSLGLSMIYLRRKSVVAFVSVAIIGFLAGTASILGIFQKGPFKEILYQESVSFRGDYWRSGLRMFQSNWLNGVGLDSFGDFYRMYRDATAAQRRGLSSTTNSGHNLLIDLGATGGVFLLLGYLLILLIIARSICLRLRNESGISDTYLVVVVLWLSFQIQTLISINVSSLAVWGWVLGGIILAHDEPAGYLIGSRNTSFRSGFKNNGFLILFCSSACLLLVLPLGFRQVELAHAFALNNVVRIKAALLLFPQDSNLSANVAKAFGKIGNETESLDLAKRSVGQNPNSIESWFIILENPKSNSELKFHAKLQIERLDPRMQSENLLVP